MHFEITYYVDEKGGAGEREKCRLKYTRKAIPPRSLIWEP
jgi:hypothetical protein